MTAPIYLGDEVSAAGYRLAGAVVRTPAPGEETAALARACAQEPRVPLVLVSAAVAAGVAEAVLARTLSALSPLVLIVPDLQGAATVPDLAARLRLQLGFEA